MSRIAEFFVAPDDGAAATALGHGPDGDEVAQYGNFSPSIAMGEWEIAFGIVHGDGPRTLDGEEIDPEFASDILGEMTSLARTATKRGHRLYCWEG